MMEGLNWTTCIALAGLALIACGEPECPSYLRTEGDDCVVPGPADAGSRTPESRESSQSTFDASTGTEIGTGRADAGRTPPPDEGENHDAAGHDDAANGGSGGAAGGLPPSAAGAGGMSTTVDAGASSPEPAAPAGPVCGDGKREGDELCDGADCPTACKSDNACLVARLEGSAATCDARCTTVETTTCGAADGCCPMGCNHGTDMDCSPSCGDGVLSGSETCEPGSSEHPCPSAADCDDRNACTEDSVTGSAQQCSARCAHKPLTRRPVDCDDGDPCTDDERVESASSCTYECVPSQPRRPTGSCVDANPCTDDTPRMSTTACELTCPHDPARAGTPCGDGRMCSADGRCEEPPARCGDGKVDLAEQCDDGNQDTTDGCIDCLVASCGDGYVRNTEECDPEADGWTILCTTSCLRTVYGICPASGCQYGGQEIPCGSAGAYCSPICTQDSDCPTLPGHRIECAGSYQCTIRCSGGCPTGMHCIEGDHCGYR